MEGLTYPDFWSLDLKYILILLWIFFPRILPILWLHSIGAPIGMWVKYIFFGCIIVPRMTLGFVLYFYFPLNRTLAIVAIIAGLFGDAIEDKIFHKKFLNK